MAGWRGLVDRNGAIKGSVPRVIAFVLAERLGCYIYKALMPTRTSAFRAKTFVRLSV